ncbi:MAG: hypothetical protein IKI04_01990, partial [Bacilli bacterium]|nr:hypothetical protein [Bacilli bacterium]
KEIVWYIFDSPNLYSQSQYYEDIIEEWLQKSDPYIKIIKNAKYVIKRGNSTPCHAGGLSLFRDINITYIK